MNADRLLKHYERIADAPDAIPKLRRFVLALAVRGKLVEQDPSEEATSVLLRRIAKEKARRITVGDVRKPRDAGGSVVAPFGIPQSWRWVRLDEVGAIVAGGTPPSADASNFAQPGDGTPWLTPADLSGRRDLFVVRGARDLSDKGLNRSSATVMPAGSVLFTSRAPIGYVAIASNPIATNQGFKSVVPYCREMSGFIALVLQACAPDIDAKAPGTTFREVSAKIVARVPFPLAPLAEQGRIVAKVDELMALCDDLETAQKAREAARERLSAASLARLTASDPDSRRLAFHIRFALDHLSASSIHSAQVDLVRRRISDLAIRGRLTSEQLSDGPATEILGQIAEVRRRLRNDKLIPRPTPLLPIAEAEQPFGLPGTWVWTRLGELCYKVADGPHFSPGYVSSEEGVPFLSTRNVRPGGFDLSSVKYVSRADHEVFCRRIRPEKGDILYTKGGTTGIARVNDLEFEFSVWVHLAVLRIEKERLSPRYVALALNSTHCYEQSQRYTQGISNFDLGLTRLVKITLPLPPYDEQLRIIDKVDELMVLCDRLEGSLAAGEVHRSRLLDALLAEALAPAQLQPA